MDADFRVASERAAQSPPPAPAPVAAAPAVAAPPPAASLPPAAAPPAPVAPPPVDPATPLPHTVVAATEVKPGAPLPDGLQADPITDKVSVAPPKMPKTIEHLKSTVMELGNTTADRTLLHPVALWLFGCLFAYVLARFRLSFAWIILTVPVFLAGFKVIVARRVRSGIRNEYLKMRYQFWPDKESVEWINHIMYLVWSNYRVFINQEVIKQATEALKVPPKGLRDLGVSHFDIGTRPPQLRNFKVYKNDPEQLLWDLELFWDGDFEVRAFVTPSVSPVKMHVKVADLFLETKVRVEANLLPNVYPFVKTVALQVLEKPKIDISVGMLGASVTDIPGFASLVRTIIVSVVEKILCPPNRFEIDVLDVLGEDPAQAKQKFKEAQANKTLLKEGGGTLSGALGSIGNLAGGLAGGVGAVGGAALHGVGAVGGKAMDGVGAVGGAAMDGIGAVGKLGSAGMGKVGGMFGMGKKDKDEVVVAAIAEGNVVAAVAVGPPTPGSTPVAVQEEPVPEKKKSLTGFLHRKH